MKRIADAIRQRRDAADATRQTAYRHLIRITRAIVEQAQQVGAVLREQASGSAQRLTATLDHFLPLVQQVIHQTTRRVLAGEQMRAREKLVSLFDW